MSAKLTERAMLDMLHARYSFVRRGTTARRYAVAEHVTNTGQTMASGQFERIADFLAQDTYRNLYTPDGRAGAYGFNDQGQYRATGEYRQPMHGHEVKVSRSDWLRELADPTKAEAWKQYCDMWWLVAPKDVVRPGELPEGWGLLTPTPRGVLRAAVQAPLLDPIPMPVSVRAQMMRAVAATATRIAKRDLAA